jgi:hypothetical protein
LRLDVARTVVSKLRTYVCVALYAFVQMVEALRTVLLNALEAILCGKAMEQSSHHPMMREPTTGIVGSTN